MDQVSVGAFDCLGCLDTTVCLYNAGNQSCARIPMALYCLAAIEAGGFRVFAGISMGWVWG